MSGFLFELQLIFPSDHTGIKCDQEWLRSNREEAFFLTVVTQISHSNTVHTATP